LRGSGGYLVPRERLDQAGQRRLSDVLSTVPGLRIISGGGGAWATTTRGGATPNLIGAAQQSPQAMIAECYCDIYVDGALLYATGTGGTPSLDLNAWAPSALEAVEFFSNPGQVPAEFSRGGAVCGVLMLWTRRDSR
jgi:hypothetical protein